MPSGHCVDAWATPGGARTVLASVGPHAGRCSAVAGRPAYCRHIWDEGSRSHYDHFLLFCVFFCNHIRASWKVPEEAAAFESRWESCPRSGPKGATGPRRTGSVTGQGQISQLVEEHSRSMRGRGARRTGQREGSLVRRLPAGKEAGGGPHEGAGGLSERGSAPRGAGLHADPASLLLKRLLHKWRPLRLLGGAVQPRAALSALTSVDGAQRVLPPEVLLQEDPGSPLQPAGGGGAQDVGSARIPHQPQGNRRRIR